MSPAVPTASSAPSAASVLALSLALSAVLAGCAGTRPTADAGGSDARYVPGDNTVQIIKDRRSAPAVRGSTLDGKPFALAGLRGDLTVINFWASWCSPCRAEAPSLEKIYESHRSAGVRFVGVDIKDNKSSAQAFARTYKITYPSLYDQAGQIALGFRDVPPNAVPSTLVIDRKGKIAARVIGSVPYQRLNGVIAQLAAEQ